MGNGAELRVIKQNNVVKRAHELNEVDIDKE